MDDFLPKPFVRAQLARALARWLPVSAQPSTEAFQGIGQVEAPVMMPLRRQPAEATLDQSRVDALRSALGEDFAEVVTVFLDSAAEVIAALKGAVVRGDPEALHLQGHALKSSAANVGAMALSALGRSLERDAKNGQLSDAVGRVEAIESELERVKPLLQAAAAQAWPQAVG